MSDALSKFIGGLQTLNPANLGAPENKAALAKFQGYDATTQKQIINDLAGKFGLTGEQATSMSEADSRRVVQNMQSGRPPLEGVTLAPTQPQQVKPPAPTPAPPVQQQKQQQPEQPDNRTFEQKWAAAQAKERGNNEAYKPAQDPSFAERYGEEAASNRHGHQNPERQAQLARISDMQREAKQTGKTFSEVADARVAAGQ